MTGGTARSAAADLSNLSDRRFVGTDPKMKYDQLTPDKFNASSYSWWDDDTANLDHEDRPLWDHVQGKIKPEYVKPKKPKKPIEQGKGQSDLSSFFGPPSKKAKK